MEEVFQIKFRLSPSSANADAIERRFDVATETCKIILPIINKQRLQMRLFVFKWYSDAFSNWSSSHTPLDLSFLSDFRLCWNTKNYVENSVHFVLHRYISKERFFRGLRQVQRLGSSLCNQVSHTSLKLHLFSFNDVRPVLHRIFIHGIVLCQKPSLLYSGSSFHFYSCRFCWTVWNWRLQHSTVITLVTEVIIAFCFSPPLSASLSTLAITVGKQFFRQEWVLVSSMKM